MTRFMLGLLITVFLCGCKSEDPNPELKDPIYKDLKAKADQHEKTIEEQMKKLGELQVKLQKSEANSIDRKDIQRDIANTKKVLGESEQWARYYRIRADRRAVVDKITARAAAQADKPWPDPREYSDYQVNRRLNEANRSWSKRVPKLEDRLSKADTKKEEKQSDSAASSD